MDLENAYPFWAIKDGLMHAFPQLRQDRRCDMALIAAGYACQHWLEQRMASNRSSFITDPRDPARLRGRVDTMAWETAQPYL